MYKKYPDHIEITKRDSKEFLKVMEIPSEIEGLPVTRIGKNSDIAEKVVNVILPDTIKEIGYSAFSESYRLKSINIPDSVVLIEANAFSFCTVLKSIHIPASVEIINNGIFHGCQELEEITVSPESKNFISQDGVLFNKDKTRLIAYPIGKKDTSYSVPDGVIEIADFAFSYSKNLVDIQFPNTVCYAEKESLLYTKWYENQPCGEVVYVGRAAYRYKVDPNDDSPFEIVLRDDTVSIGDEAFSVYPYKGYNITSINFPDTLKSIGTRSFEDCKMLKEIDLPDGLEYVGYCAFVGCSLIDKIKIPKGIKKTEAFAFSVTNPDVVVYMPDSIEYIETNTFGSELTLFYGGTNEQWDSIPKNTNPGLQNIKNIHIIGNPGDINLDQKVDAVDIAIMKEHLKKGSGFPLPMEKKLSLVLDKSEQRTQQELNSDLIKDNILNGFDLVSLIRTIMNNK